MAEMMSYDKSPIPPEKPGGFASGRNLDMAITVDERLKLNYASAAAEGRVEIELPSLPGSPNSVERLHAVDFGAHVAGKIESSMTQQGYIKSGPQQTGPQVFRHYLASAKGAHLMDSATLSNMETLANDFEREPERNEFYKQVVRPYLRSLTPGRR